MPVTRRRPADFEIILPFNNIPELDRAIERLLRAPLLPAANHPLQIANQLPVFMPNVPLNRFETDQRDLVNNMMTFTVTNINPPDQDGNRMVQRTFFQIIDPNDQNAQLATDQFANMLTPRASLESSRFGPAYNPLLIPETNQAQQPTVLFNPTNLQQPYRNLDSTFMPSFPTPNFPTTTPASQERSAVRQFEAIDTFFDRILEDLTQLRPATRSNRRSRLMSFPLDNSQSIANDQIVNESESRPNRTSTRRREQTNLRANRRRARRNNPGQVSDPQSGRENQDERSSNRSNSSSDQTRRSSRAKKR